MLISTFLLIHYILPAQKKSRVTPICVGAIAPYLLQPGLKLGTPINLKKIKSKKKKYQSNLYVQPQVGSFVRIKNHSNFLVASDLGYKLKSKKNFYFAGSIGLGYLISIQKRGFSINLSNGDVNSKEHELRSFILPVLNFEIGKQKKNKLGWYTKLSYGRKIAFKIEDAAFFAIEAGIIIQLKLK